MQLKLLFLLVCVTCIAVTVAAQTLPKTEFQLVVPITNIAIKRGETDSVQVSIVRSRHFKSGDAVLALSSPVKTGMTVEIHPSTTIADTWLLVISVSELIDVGDYTLIPSCTLNRKIKGAVVKVTIQ